MKFFSTADVELTDNGISVSVSICTNGKALLYAENVNDIAKLNETKKRILELISKIAGDTEIKEIKKQLEEKIKKVVLGIGLSQTG